MQAMEKALEEGLATGLPARLKSILREAYEGHAGQFRTSRSPQHRVPFIAHPVGVAKLAITHYPIAKNHLADDLETVACVALSHDLLEDTRVPSSRLEEEAGSKVREYVEALTKSPAGIAGRTGEERNQELLRKILRAGPTAVFVKICDSMHNLSRPALTPTDLLAKTVEKARSQYLPLLDRCPLGKSFREVYLATIEYAEKALAEELKFIRAAPAVLTLEDAIRECVAASAGKLLELHDITAILKRIGATESVGCWQLKSVVDGIFEPVAGMGPEVRTLHWPAGELTESAQFFKGVAQRFGAAFCVEKPDTVITVPFRTDADTSFIIAMGLGSETRQTWVNKETTSLLVQFLAHRLILSETDRRGRLATEAANLGLQLRTEVAARVGVQPSQLPELQRWRLRCEQAVAVVNHAVNMILMSGSCSIPLGREIKIESRVKTVDSILMKLLKTHTAWPNYESIEDIAGVRVICPTQAGVGQLEQALLSSTTGLILHRSILKPRRDYVANPTSEGYRALHLILEVKTRFGDEASYTVPCELQLRTMFQDTWAKLSHALAYQAGTEAKWHAEQLRKLSGILKSYEENSEKVENR